MIIDAVILAAGRNARLGEAVPPFYKPLMTVDGVPLIVQAVDLAAKFCHSVTIVAAPENVLPMMHVLNGRDVFVNVQTKPNGPGDALRIGLRGLDAEKSLVMMGDNTFRYADIQKMITAGARCDETAVVGTGLEPTAAAENFTMITHQDGNLIRFREDKTSSVPLSYIDPATGMVTVWKGPLLLPTGRAQLVFGNKQKFDYGEMKIGPLLNDFADQMVLVDVQTQDIGLPEMLP
jgi:bifunctional N-acetylglucosamine-1-phosphate-uridyltransferase/glucosamine-1-phosphate-acetyltransferase GlmU-like protein